MNITIKKIAADLKLAVSTVSKALRDSHEISEATKKRVLEYAQKIDFVPNAYAGSLKKKKTGNIAVVIPEVADGFFSLAINGIESVAQEKGYHVIIYLTHEDQKRESSILRNFRSGRVDGVLMSVSGGQGSNQHIRDLVNAKLPLVFFDRVCEDIDADKVVTDDFEAAYKATVHLLEKGCREIAFLSPSENLGIISARQNGYQKALADHNVKFRKEHVIDCDHSTEHNYATIKKLLTSKKRPDGIIASVEKLALLTYSICNDLKLSIPKNLKIIGFSSLNTVSLLKPSLTTITQPAFEIGKEAATLLFKGLSGNKSERKKKTVSIPSVLIERDSTKK